MLKRFSATKKVGAQGGPEGSDVGIDELVIRIKQLIRHRGYDRTKINSSCLKRYLTSERSRDWAGEGVLRQHYATAQIDRRTFAYLVENVNIELQMAHERLTG